MDSINDYTPDLDESDDHIKQFDDETAIDESVQPHDERDPSTDSSGEIDTYQQDTILEDQSTATSTVITPSCMHESACMGILPVMTRGWIWIWD